MSENSSALPSVVQIVEVASRYPARALPPGYHQSYPMPTLGSSGLRAAFLYCKGAIIEPGEGLKLRPPSFLAFIHWPTAMFEELRAVESRELGQSVDEDAVIGAYLTIPERMQPEFLTKQIRLYQAYDVLVSAFAVKDVGINNGLDLKRVALEFKRLFSEATEAPLYPYYRSVGAEFWKWCDHIAA